MVGEPDVVFGDKKAITMLHHEFCGDFEDDGFVVASGRFFRGRAIGPKMDKIA